MPSRESSAGLAVPCALVHRIHKAFELGAVPTTTELPNHSGLL